MSLRVSTSSRYAVNLGSYGFPVVLLPIDGISPHEIEGYLKLFRRFLRDLLRGLDRRARLCVFRREVGELGRHLLSGCSWKSECSSPENIKS